MTTRVRRGASRWLPCPRDPVASSTFKVEKENRSDTSLSVGPTVGAQLEGRTERSEATGIQVYPQCFLKPVEPKELFWLYLSVFRNSQLATRHITVILAA